MNNILGRISLTVTPRFQGRSQCRLPASCRLAAPVLLATSRSALGLKHRAVRVIHQTKMGILAQSTLFPLARQPTRRSANTLTFPHRHLSRVGSKLIARSLGQLCVGRVSLCQSEDVKRRLGTMSAFSLQSCALQPPCTRLPVFLVRRLAFSLLTPPTRASLAHLTVLLSIHRTDRRVGRVNLSTARTSSGLMDRSNSTRKNTRQ